MLSFFSLTNSFISLRNLQYSSHKSSRPLITFLDNSHLKLIIPPSSCSTTNNHFSPTSLFATLFTIFSHSIYTSFTKSYPFMPPSNLLLALSKNLCTSAFTGFWYLNITSSSSNFSKRHLLITCFSFLKFLHHKKIVVKVTAGWLFELHGRLTNPDYHPCSESQIIPYSTAMTNF